MSVLLENLAGQTVDRNAPKAMTTTRRHIVLVLSASDEPSRSAVVDNLAAASAEAGQRAIVVDALDTTPDDAASGLLEPGREIEIEDIERRLEPSRLENVALLKLSRVIGNSSQLLTHAPAVLRAAEVLADIVIIEAPPLLAFHDGEALAAASDVVLLVAENGRTTASQARRAGELLRRFDAPVLGVVFTGVRAKSDDVLQADRNRAPGGRRSNLEPSRTAAGAATAGSGQ
jgi:Mrp family chromosome partitioning ATPase